MLSGSHNADIPGAEHVGVLGHGGRETAALVKSFDDGRKNPPHDSIAAFHLEQLHSPLETAAASNHYRQLLGKTDQILATDAEKAGEELLHSRELPASAYLQQLVPVVGDLPAGFRLGIGLNPALNYAVFKGVVYVSILHWRTCYSRLNRTRITS